jgi:VanZ family protein
VRGNGGDPPHPQPLSRQGRGESGKRTLLYASLLAGAAAVVFELGQMMLPGRYGSPTDVLFGVIGGYLGARFAAMQIRTPTDKLC